MKRNEKAVPVLAHRDGGDGQLSLNEVWLPKSEHITGRKNAQGISSLLLRGEVNALPLAELERLTGLDRREIRRRIQRERGAGACICINNRDGYFLAETVTERDACVRSMRHRAAEVWS